MSSGLNPALSVSAEYYWLSVGHPISAALEHRPILLPAEHLEKGGLEACSVTVSNCVLP